MHPKHDTPDCLIGCCLEPMDNMYSHAHYTTTLMPLCSLLSDVRAAGTPPGDAADTGLQILPIILPQKLAKQDHQPPPRPPSLPFSRASHRRSEAATSLNPAKVDH